MTRFGTTLPRGNLDIAEQASPLEVERENCSDLELIWAVRGVRIKSHTCALQQEQTRWNLLFTGW